MRARPHPWLVALVVLLALAPRVAPALRGFNFSPDAAEYLLIARSLRAGEGFTLPIRVRFTRPGPARHEAYAERAPLYPWLLSALVTPEPGWPSPRLQLSGLALAALAVLLACSLSAETARRRGLRGPPLQLAVMLGGLAVGWLPFLVRASVHLWAEPLGLVLALGALRLAWVGEERPGAAVLAAEALCLGLARFARPEGWVLVPALLGWHWAVGQRQRALLLAGGVVALNALGVALTGVLAPQLELLQTRRFEDLMAPGAELGVSASQVAQGIARNAWHQAKDACTPRHAGLIVPLALLGLRAPGARLLALAAGALSLATVIVWSTDDPSRFLIAPLALLAPLGAVELLVRWRRHAAGRRWALALGVGLWLGILGHGAGRTWRGRHAPAPGPIAARAGTPALADPWRYALVTGREATLAEGALRASTR